MKLVTSILAALVLAFAVAAAVPAYADTAAKAQPQAPAVKLPYTFVCPHCGMKITIKTEADWFKSCMPCPCGTNNLGCYNALKKH